jgi:hypothetical protein
VDRAALGKKHDPISKITRAKKAHTVELLPTKCKSLSSTTVLPSAPPAKKKKKKKKIQQDSLLFCLGLVTHLAFLRASSELVWVWFGLF